MKKQTVVLGISSGIAAYKSIELVQLLKKEGVEVYVIMTKSAAKMVLPQEFEKASGNKVYIELFEENFNYKDVLKIRKVDHIDLADKADVFVVAPATANIIAKISHGLADDFLTTSLLATQAPVLICPSMNVHMYENPVVQDNLKKLRSRGFFIMEPEEGDLACGYRGKGRLAHIYHIRDEISSILQNREPASQRGEQLKGRKILVTAGGTIEKIDDVRFITNRSSGKMGIAISEECFLRGGNVLLLRSKTSVLPRYLIAQETFETADELERLVTKHVKTHDVMFHVAAVSDFSIKNPKRGKISSKKSSTLTLKPTRKIINNIRKINPKIELIAFKAKWRLKEKDVPLIAKEKLSESKADAIVINDVSKIDRGFGADTNEVFVVTKSGSKIKIPLSSKQDIAKGIIDFLQGKTM